LGNEGYNGVFIDQERNWSLVPKGTACCSHQPPNLVPDANERAILSAIQRRTTATTTSLIHLMVAAAATATAAEVYLWRVVVVVVMVLLLL
jgi:hypothetical protein